MGKDMITEERKQVILKFAIFCITFDGELLRPSIVNDEEWDWLIKGYTEVKNNLKDGK